MSTIYMLAVDIFGRSIRASRFPRACCVSLQNLDTSWSGSTLGLTRRMRKRITQMAIGTVKWFNSTKGFGFIQPDDGGEDVFVHISAVERAGLSGLVEGQKINFEVQRDRRTGKSAAENLSKAA